MAARFQIASVGEYCDDKEDFESYTERLSAWLVVNAVTDDQKSSVFLAVIGFFKEFIGPRETQHQNI